MWRGISVTHLWALLPGCSSSQGKVCRRWAWLLHSPDTIALSLGGRGSHPPSKDAGLFLVFFFSSSYHPPLEALLGMWGRKGPRAMGISGKQTLRRGKWPAVAAQNLNHNKRPSPPPSFQPGVSRGSVNMVIFLSVLLNLSSG